MTWRDFLYHCKQEFRWFKPNGARNFGILIYGTASCFSLPFPDLRTQYFVSVTSWLRNSPLWSVHYKVNVDILKCFVIECAVQTTLVQPRFCQRFVSKLQILDLFLIDLNNLGQTAFSHKEHQTRKAWKRSTEPAALQAPCQIQVGQYDVMLCGLAAEQLFENGGCRCRILGFFREAFLGIACTSEAETLLSNLTQYKLFIDDDKKICFLEWPSPVLKDLHH